MFILAAKTEVFFASFSRGFSLREVAIPVSTTHCQIGGVVGAGLVRYLTFSLN